MLCWVVCCLVWLISALDESCSELPPVDNSVFVATEVEGQILGDYLCIKGYHLVGKQSLVLNVSEELDVSPPECRLGHCPEPVLENGTTNYSRPVSAGDKIMFKCIDGYILKGSSWSQCQEDHTWAPSLPICRSRDCDPPGIPSHGYFEGGSFTSGSVVTYYCRDRYNVCPKGLHCVAMAYVTDLHAPFSHVTWWGLFQSDQPRHFQVFVRYHLVGTQELHCVDGEWNSSYPTCEPAPRPADQIALEKAILAFQESKDLCSATENFVRRLKESGLTMEELKYSLEMKKIKLKEDFLLKYHS